MAETRRAVVRPSPLVWLFLFPIPLCDIKVSSRSFTYVRLAYACSRHQWEVTFGLAHATPFPSSRDERQEEISLVIIMQLNDAGNEDRRRLEGQRIRVSLASDRPMPCNASTEAGNYQTIESTLQTRKKYITPTALLPLESIQLPCLRLEPQLTLYLKR